MRSDLTRFRHLGLYSSYYLAWYCRGSRPLLCGASDLCSVYTFRRFLVFFRLPHGNNVAGATLELCQESPALDRWHIVLEIKLFGVARVLSPGLYDAIVSCGHDEEASHNLAYVAACLYLAHNWQQSLPATTLSHSFVAEAPGRE